MLAPGSMAESWTLLGDDLRPVGPVESFLAYLSAIERSPNTIKAYAHDLKDWWVYLAGRAVDWQRVDLEAVAGFVAWLRLPPLARSGAVAVLPTVEHHCTAASVNRKLAAVGTFNEFYARNGVTVADMLTTMRPVGLHRSAATSYKPFLQHVASGNPERTRTIKLKTMDKPAPKSLRGRSGRRVGGQGGHEGRTLRQVEVPDETVLHEPAACAGCGDGLADAAVVAVTRRQVFEIPRVAARVVEHRIVARRRGCATVTCASAPAGVDAPVQYGPRLTAVVVYLLVAQFGAQKRVAQAVADLFGVPISQGSVAALTARAARRLDGDFLAACVPL